LLRLLTFGSLSVLGADGPLKGAAAQPRRLAVLVVVARGGERGATRGKLLSLLWPDASEEQGRRVMTQALYALRRDLGGGHDDAIVGTRELRLNRDIVWCDAAEFEAALAEGNAAHASTLYVGPFLDGFRLPTAPEFERWVDDERIAIQHRYHAALEGLARAAEARGAFGDAAMWWRRRAADDPLNARVAVAVMRAAAAAGDRGAALRHAQIFEALLAEQLDVPADREVIELADSLRREARATAAASAPTQAPAPQPERPKGIQSIAVLPLAALGPNRADHDHSHWSDGLAEEMINALLGVSAMRVVARSASFALGPTPSLASLRQELRVSHAVEGSVRRIDSGVRVTVRLIETGEGHAVWWERFDCSVAESTEMQEHIAQRVAERVRALAGEWGRPSL
jgi:TolB-like protein/DNA-binding winged helix-turn-helix (wHTH) protein